MNLQKIIDTIGVEPYYQEKNGVLYNADCMDILPKIPKKCIDLVLTDPPYGTIACKWDSIIPLKDMWNFLNGVIKEDNLILLFSMQPFTSKLVISNIDMFKTEWIWNKNKAANFMTLKRNPLKIHEQILVFSKNSNFVFNPIRVLRTESSLKSDPIGKERKVNINKKHASVSHYGTKRSLFSHYSIDGYKHPVDIVNISSTEKKETIDFKHPTKKPVSLMEYFIKTYSNENDIVLDFTIGSGTTAIAAKNLNRKYIGIEISKEYCKIAKDRIIANTIPKINKNWYDDKSKNVILNKVKSLMEEN